MSFIVDTIVCFCIKNGFVEAKKIEWLRYGIEKRLSTFLVLVPFLILAASLSKPLVAISFFIGFFSLKRYTNGFHAKTFCGCLCASLLLECFFLCFLYPSLNLASIIWINIVGRIAITVLAPYNHPNIHLTEEEIIALKEKSCSTISYLNIAVATCAVTNLLNIAKGLTVGIAMATFLLCLAYMPKRRNHK